MITVAHAGRHPVALSAAGSVRAAPSALNTWNKKFGAGQAAEVACPADVIALAVSGY